MDIRRNGEAMHNTFTTEIDAPPAKVFKWIYDKDCNLQWLPNLVEATMVDEKPGGVGSTFRQIYLENGRRIEMRGVVTAYEQDRYLACDIRSDAIDLVVEYRLDDLGSRTRVTQNSRLGFKGIAMKIAGVLLNPMMRRMSARQYSIAFDKLRACIAADRA
jgi:uncharacterized protein YndB with AHSA1/START domain